MCNFSGWGSLLRNFALISALAALAPQPLHACSEDLFASAPEPELAEELWTFLSAGIHQLARVPELMKEFEEKGHKLILEKASLMVQETGTEAQGEGARVLVPRVLKPSDEQNSNPSARAPHSEKWAANDRALDGLKRDLRLSVQALEWIPSRNSSKAIAAFIRRWVQVTHEVSHIISGRRLRSYRDRLDEVPLRVATGIASIEGVSQELALILNEISPDALITGEDDLPINAASLDASPTWEPSQSSTSPKEDAPIDEEDSWSAILKNPALTGELRAHATSLVAELRGLHERLSQGDEDRKLIARLTQIELELLQLNQE